MTPGGMGAAAPMERSGTGPVLTGLKRHIGSLDAAAAVRLKPPSFVSCQTKNRNQVTGIVHNSRAAVHKLAIK